MEPVTLLLSPHLDDAVLSCPTYVQRASNPVIATVFTEGRSLELYRERRAEDRAAADILGARVAHLGLLDAPFRSSRYQGFRGIIFGRASNKRDVMVVIRTLLERTQPSIVVAPLAAGNHVDHRLVRDAALDAVPPDLLRFYEDRPYSFILEHVGHALGVRRIGEGQPPEFWRRYFETTYVRNYLGGSMTPQQLDRAWSRVPPFPKPLRIAQSIKPTARELKRAIEAISAYGTQVPDLFRDTKEMTRLYRSRSEIQYCLDYH